MLIGENWAIFDLDGTLNQTNLVSVDAHQRVEREMGLPEQSAETIIATFGGRACDTYPLLAPGFSEKQLREYQENVARAERENLPKMGRFYQGCDEMLLSLRNKGWHTAVCSNATERYIECVLDAIRLRSLIDELRPLEDELTKIDTLRLLLQKVQPQTAIMIGDRHYDAQAARENGIPFIGCCYGFAPNEMKTERYHVTKPLEIVEIAEELKNKILPK